LVLAFDFGRRRIGVACGDTLSRTARPLSGVVNSATGPRWESVDSLLREWQPTLIVVGLPYNVDGSESVLCGAARRFASEFEARSGIPSRLVDERYSSLDAEKRLKEARASGLRKRRVAKVDIDAAAACIILERWFTQTG
jgi:putative Holliday junction resolvase